MSEPTKISTGIEGLDHALDSLRTGDNVVWQINSLAEKGEWGTACVYASFLIVFVYAIIALMNLFIKHFGTSKYMED